MDMGETQSKLSFRVVGVTPAEATTGATAYEATSAGVAYRVVGTMVDPVTSSRRTFRAYRIGAAGRLVPAAAGGEHRTRAAAYAQAERDLEQILADRAAEEAEPVTAVGPMTVTASGARKITAHLASRADLAEQTAGRTLRAPVVPSEFDPATDDDIAELLERIVRRAQYEALRMVLSVLNEGVQSTRDFCVEQEHGSANSHDDGQSCGEAFDVDDFQRMVNDAARRLHTSEPWHPDA